MAARHLSCFDDWKTAILTCPACGWRGRFDEGSVEYHSKLMDSSCPACADMPMLAVVFYPTIQEEEANIDRLSDEAKASLAGRKEFLAKLDRTRLISPEDLPDLRASFSRRAWFRGIRFAPAPAIGLPPLRGSLIGPSGLDCLARLPARYVKYKLASARGGSSG
ncbi:MAG: hypothetical protein ACE15C_12295 [Phycisphaerae bacterium]